MQPESGQNSISKFARKLGAVTAAASALLASGTANSHESDLLKGILDRAVVISSSSEIDQRVKVLLPPLILKPSDAKNGSMMAGHRSHSSHSSHSSHQSHVSSTVGGSRSYRSSSAGMDSGAVPVTPARATVPRSNLTAPIANKTTDGKYQPPEGVDLDKPEERFQLLSIPQIGDGFKAQIKDMATGRAVLYEVGDAIAQYTVDEIDIQNKAILLLGKKNEKVVLKKKK